MARVWNKSLLLLVICSCLVSVSLSQDLPDTDYFNWIKEHFIWINRWRTNPWEAWVYHEMQDEWRTMDFEYNGLPARTYACFDDLKDLKEKGNRHCNNVGIWRSGSGAIQDAINYFFFLEDPETEYIQNSLQWSDELTLSASLYMQEFEGCSLWQLNLQEDLPVHDELIKLGVEFEDHMRIVLYPERFKWSNP